MNPSAPLSPLSPPDDLVRFIRRCGHLGLVPFVGLAGLMWLVSTEALPYVALTLVAHAALVASFLGGIHWGVVWTRLSGLPGLPTLSDRQVRHRVVWGLTPSVLAWPGVLMPAHAALPWLGALLLTCYAMDRKLYREAGLSTWLDLRFRLSAVASLSCFIAAGAV